MSLPRSQADSGEGEPLFRDRVRAWRREAIYQAVSDLLREEGCFSLTMEHIAKRAGIAKGSLYLHTQNRTELIAEVLDRWAADVEAPDATTAHGSSEAVARVCAALFQDVERNDEAARKHGDPLLPPGEPLSERLDRALGRYRRAFRAPCRR